MRALVFDRVETLGYHDLSDRGGPPAPPCDAQPRRAELDQIC
jgi:hypothetical protein